MTDDRHRFATRAIHAGQQPDPTTGAIMPPIYQTSTYVQEALGKPRAGYEYARVQNPTRHALQENIAALEGGRHGAAFATGLAAIEAVVKRLSAGDHVVTEENTYGGTTRMFQHVLSRLGIEFTFVDSRDTDQIRDAIRPNTKLVHLETPTNPMMRLTDLPAAAEVAHAADALVCVDNTFATPYNQRPLELGADIVVHSTTKYLNGHSDVVGGMVVTNNDDVAEELYFLQKSAGAVPGPMDCWLVLRGTKTLHVRMETHNRNGLAVAEFLEQHSKVEQVNYPGLASHPQHELAKRQMHGFTGMLSLELGSPERARKMVEGTRIFALAESLGGVESLIGLPALQTHASVPADRRAAMGITDSLVRLSVGIEDIDDLLEDLDQALADA
ncbi:MAG: cystathionine gamma-synthase [Gemmatimonadota bacterium]|jgi:cystathionine gamma-lyase